MPLKAKDKKVIKAFADQKPAEGHLLSTDGKTLEKLGMGRQKIAWWKGYDVHVFPSLPHVKSDEVILRALRKAIPKNWLKEGTGDTTAKLHALLGELRGDGLEEARRRKAKASMSDVTPEQAQALRDYAEWAGTKWKDKLSTDWMRGGSNWHGPYNLLHQVRNRQGPSWLHALKLEDDDLDGEPLDEMAPLPRPGARFEADGQMFQIVKVYPTTADALGPLSRDLFRLIVRGGSAAIGKQLRGSQDKGHYLICFNPHGDLDGHPVWMKPLQVKRAFKYEGVELDGELLDEVDTPMSRLADVQGEVRRVMASMEPIQKLLNYGGTNTDAKEVKAAIHALKAAGDQAKNALAHLKRR